MFFDQRTDALSLEAFFKCAILGKHLFGARFSCIVKACGKAFILNRQHLDEYADASTERGQILLNSICKEMGFHSLGYQTLDGLLEAIGLDRDKVCTYCWTGEE